MGGIAAVMINGLLRLSKFRILAKRMPGVWIAVIIGEVAAGDFDLNSMSLLKHVTDRH